MKINKHLIEIFGDLLAIEGNPNPLAEGLSNDADNTIKCILDKFEISGGANSYALIFKMMWNKYELVNNFLKIHIFQSLAKFVSNSDFQISSEALTVFMEILLTENKKVEEAVSIGGSDISFW